MGVVRQAVKRSAGRSGFMGSSWSLEQAASWIQFLMRWRRRELCCSCLRSSSSDFFHILPLMLLSKVLETVHNDASIVTVIDIDTWGAHPALQVIYRQRYVLSVGPTTHTRYS